MPLYVLNVTYPLIDDEVVDFRRGKDAVLVVEEAQPDYIEQNLAKILRNAGVDTKLAGKGPLPMAGEYTAKVLIDGVAAFLRTHAAGMLPDRLRAPNVPATAADEDLAALAKEVPIRPAGFCTGCPERPIFAAMKLVQEMLANTRWRATSAAISSRSCRRSTSAARPWAMGLGLRPTRPSTRRRRSGRSR